MQVSGNISVGPVRIPSLVNARPCFSAFGCKNTDNYKRGISELEKQLTVTKKKAAKAGRVKTQKAEIFHFINKNAYVSRCSRGTR